MSEQPSISTTHFSRILIELGRYIQKINLDRIIDGLEAEKIIYSPTAQELRKIDDEFDKSNIVTGMMQGRKEKDFKTFLKIIAAEKPGSKFYDATREFFSGFWQFQGYDKYANWPNVEFSTCGFKQIGSEIVLHVGKNGAVSYDPVHGSMICVAENSLPDGVDEVTIKRKHGFDTCGLHPSMQTCSATVYFEIYPKIEFTKDVFIEIPHSFSSVNTQDLCFVKFDRNMDSTGYGEIFPGLFPTEYPYGVIATKTFSLFKVSTKKRFKSKKLGKKIRVHKLRQQLRSAGKIAKSKESNLIKKESSVSNTVVAHSVVPNSYWFSIIESPNKLTTSLSLSLSQFTPTGQKIMMQSKKGKTCVLTELTFQSDELVCHPQTAKDCGWAMHVAGDKYQIQKREVDSNSHCEVVKYNLVLSEIKSSTSCKPCMPITVTGGENTITYHVTDLHADTPASIVDDELLQKLYSLSVNPHPFLQMLAWKLPFWQPLARLLGLSEVDVQEIEANYPIPSPKGEQAYQALLKWMQTKGRDATYGELLVALYNAFLSNDNVTDAWWYAYNKLTHSIPL